MPRLSTARLPQQQRLNELLVYAGLAPRKTDPTPASLLRAYRAALRMPQRELARRAGMTQSHVARLEADGMDALWGTWRRLFDAMECDLLMLPRPRTRPREWLAQKRLEGDAPRVWPQRPKSQRHDYR